MTPNPLWQLTLTRLRIFWREPSAIFWTFGFPIALSIALGIAFRNRPPEAVRIGVWSASAASRSDDVGTSVARSSRSAAEVISSMMGVAGRLDHGKRTPKPPLPTNARVGASYTVTPGSKKKDSR